MNTIWVQREIQLPACRRGIHPIGRYLMGEMPELSQVNVGLLHVFLQHTSASLTINENADPDVLLDLDDMLNTLIPERRGYRHDDEGADDMPAHGKASLMGYSLTLPVADGRLRTGIWQGICLCEHRNHGGRRRVVVTLNGQASG